MTKSPETYGTYLNTALEIARSDQGMDGALKFIVFELDGDCAKMVLAHVINLIIEWEKTHPDQVPDAPEM